MRATDLTVEEVAIDSIHPDPKNAKLHPEDQIENLRASLRRFGFRDPIGIDGNAMIIEGEGRWRAAKAEGLSTVLVIRLDHLSKKERDAYALAHNQTQLSSGMDFPMLNAELERLEVGSEDLPSIGFTEADLFFMQEELTPQAEPGAVVSDGAEHSESWQNLVSEVVKSTIVFGDLTQLSAFHSFLTTLAERYPDAPTESERLLRFAREFPAV